MVRRNLNGPYPDGVANPYSVHVHPYPTRFHGGIYTRPVFGLPYVRSPHAVFKPDDFYEYYGVKGLGEVVEKIPRNTYVKPIFDSKKLTVFYNGLKKASTKRPFTGARVPAYSGTLDSRLCAAFLAFHTRYPNDIFSYVPKTIVAEALTLCGAPPPLESKKLSGLGSVGSLNCSSLGNNVFGGNTLGLGATGTPIYYLASSSNPKVVTIQGGLNKVLVANGYREIPVTGKLDYKTCAALGLMYGKFPSEVLSQVDRELLEEAAKTCNLAQKNSTVMKQTVAYAQELEDNKNPTPAKVLVPQTEAVPPTTAPVVLPPPPAAPVPPTTPPVAQPVPVLIQEVPPAAVPQAPPVYVTQSEDFPEMTIEEAPPPKSFGKMGLLVAAAGGAALLLFLMKSKAAA